MKRDFKIDQTIALKTEQGYYDMHNCYEFAGYNLTGIVDKTLELNFEKTVGSWVDESDPQKIRIVFHRVQYLKINLSFYDEAFDAARTLSDLNSISEIGFKPGDDFDMDYFYDDEKSLQDYHIIFYIDDVNYVRVYADEVNVVIS